MPRGGWAPMPRSWRAGAAAVAYAAFLLLCVEAALQAFYYATAGDFLFARVGRPIWAPNPHSTFWTKPNLAFEHKTNEFRTWVYTNSDGFRVAAPGEEYAIPKDPAKFRVMLLGPSFAFGWGVNHEDTFAARLERLLREAGYGGGREVELINAGVPTLGAGAQLRWFERRGRDFAPDLVIQFAYGSMAVDTSLQTQYAVDPDGYLVLKDLGRRGRMIQQAKQSAVVFYGWIVATRLRQLLGDEPPDAAIEGAGRTLTERARFDPAEEEAARCIGLYDRLKAVVAGGGGRVLVVYFPLAYSVHPEDAARWRHLGVRNIEAQRAYDADFCRYVDARGVPCLNISDDLVRAAREGGERLYYWLDIHWTPAGNRVAAEAVARYLLGARSGSG